MAENASTINWDKSVDILVVGSGNGALTTALCSHEMGVKDVLVIEKEDQFGGSSSISGGGVWIPCNRYALEAGTEDSIADAKSYLSSVIPTGTVPEDLIDVFLAEGPNMVDFLHNHTRVRYESLAYYPDYYSDAPGARGGHRSMEPAKLNLSDLGENWKKLRNTHHMMWLFNRVAYNQVEAGTLAARAPGWIKLAIKLMIQYISDIPWLFKSPRSRLVACGMAGVGRLRLSMMDRDMPLWLNTELKELISDDNGKVIGALIERDGKTLHIEARKGVMLACGGFEHNQAMREKYLPQPTNSQWSAGHFGNTGDGIKAAEKVGAELTMMDGAWWCATIKVPAEERPRLSIMEKSMPGNVLVNPAGKRIANESENYMAYQTNWHNSHSNENPSTPAYMVFDNRFRNSYLVGPIVGNLMPDWVLPKAWFDEDFLYKADTLEELATQTGIDVDGLKQTVTNMNNYAKTGVDEEFGRGSYEYDRYYGDQSITPNPCLAAIEQAPFYALKQDPGDFGTHGGVAFNHHAQVLKSDGSPIDGLYACGNTARALLPNYPGPGATLGPAMTFGYLAAKHLSEKSS
ncbi:MAG: FAD-binding protein [Pseudomonadales bacterium]|nr:FAD-binding protein [Pseudomonadales bacterium]